MVGKSGNACQQNKHNRSPLSISGCRSGRGPDPGRREARGREKKCERKEKERKEIK